jgi:hypothetical protein
MKPTLEAINQFWMGVASHKAEIRKKQGALSFTEKIKILEKLRDRDRAIAASGLRGRKQNADKRTENPRER